MTASDTLKEFAAGYLRLTQLLADMGDDQWKPGNSPTPREDTTERSKGMTSDPTVNTVADPRRLALRAAVVEAEQALAGATTTMRKAEDNLSSAYSKWLG